MQFIYAMLIGGIICAFTQCLSELKIPFPLIAILLMTAGGGLLTYLGIYDKIGALGVGGAAVTAMGCGNGAYSSGLAILSGNIVPLILVGLLNIALVAMGAACGGYLLKKYPEKYQKSAK